MRANGWTSKERKGKWTCIAPIVSTSTTKRSVVDHTRVTCIYITSAFPSYKHSLESDTAANSFFHPATDILLISRPTEGRRLSGPSWSTHSERLAHEVVTRQPPWIRRRSGKVRQLQTDVLTTRAVRRRRRAADRRRPNVGVAPAPFS